MSRFKRKGKIKKNLVVAWFMVGVAMLFAWRYPYGKPILDEWFEMMGIPAWSDGLDQTTGVHYTAIVGIFLFIFGLFILARYYRGRTVFAIFIACLIFPPIVANAYQSTFARGIYALDYNKDNSHCNYDTNQADILTGKCSLPFTNHSNQSVVFYIKLKSNFQHGPRIEDITGLKHHRLVIRPHEQKNFIITFSHPLRSKKYQGLSGSGNGFDVVVKSGGHTREM